MIKFKPNCDIKDFDISTFIIISMWLFSFMFGFVYLFYLPYYNPFNSFLCIIFIPLINCAIFSSYFEDLSLDYDIQVFKRIPSHPILWIHGFDYVIMFILYFFANIAIILTIGIAEYKNGYTAILLFIIFSLYCLASVYSSWDKE